MKTFLKVIVTLALVTAVAAYAGYSYLSKHYWHAASSLDVETELLVERGATSNAIIGLLDERGIIATPQLFKLFAYQSGDLGHYKAGEYRISPEMTNAEISALLRKGSNLQRRITIPEGLLTSDIIARVKAHPHLQGEISTVPDEGWLKPDTYLFSRNMSREALVTRMQESQKTLLQKAWENRQPDLPLRSAREALILASIVEKETGVNDERDKVAGVFINRLRKGMKLQSDPTANYGLYLRTGALKKRLLLDDVADESAYNTYVIDGLPPTPICNPGEAAIMAVLHPKATDALYFVADGKGGHVFADTLSAHNRNVAAYHALMRKRRREMRR